MCKARLDPPPALLSVTLLEIQRSHQAKSGGGPALCGIGQQLIRLILESSRNPHGFRYGLQHVFILPVIECSARVKGVVDRDNTAKSIWEISYTLREVSYSIPTKIASAERFRSPAVIVALRHSCKGWVK
jgi:hypothetical protein